MENQTVVTFLATLATLSTLAALDRELAVKMGEVMKQLREMVRLLQEQIDVMTIEEILELLPAEEERPKIIRVSYRSSDTPCWEDESRTVVLLLRDAKQSELAVPVVLAGGGRESAYRFNIELFVHRYPEKFGPYDGHFVNARNVQLHSETVSRSWSLAHEPSWFRSEETALKEYLEYYRSLLQAAKETGIKKLYRPLPNSFHSGSVRLCQFAFEQARQELGVECAWVDHFDPSWCEWKDGKLALAANAPALLKYLL